MATMIQYLSSRTYPAHVRATGAPPPFLAWKPLNCVDFECRGFSATKKQNPTNAAGLVGERKDGRMVKKSIALLTVLGILGPLWAKDKMNLYLDYTALKQWRYVLSYHAERVIEGKKQSSAESTDISCMLVGDLAKNKERLTFTVKRPDVTSGIYDDETVQRVTQSLKDSEYGLAIINGCPTVDTLGALSSQPPVEWDLYFQFAKLLPDMPQDPVKAGYTWERTALHPIRTAAGVVPCQVYRLYKVDEVSESKGAAYISWEFTYQAEKSAMDSPRILERVPVTGKGTGTATVDLIDGFIQEANVKFDTPTAKADSGMVTWKEEMNLVFRFAR